MSKIEFTTNYSDLSTDEGFQFEFFCDRCGTGYRTSFQPSAIGKISGALDAAGSLLGGVLVGLQTWASVHALPPGRRRMTRHSVMPWKR